MENTIEIFPPFTCSTHERPMRGSQGDLECDECESSLRLERNRRSWMAHSRVASSQRDEKVKFAYKIYAFVYPVVALFACWFVWRASVRKQIRFYREAIRSAKARGQYFLDAGTGDGSLTKLAMRGVDGAPAMLAVDLSQDMLKKAARKFKRVPNSLFYVSDITTAALKKRSFPTILSFGTVHVFSDPLAALSQIRELLSDDGEFAGSYLLSPGTRRRNKVAAWAIKHGLLATAYSEKDFDELLESAGLEYAEKELNGRMLLFRARRKSDS